MLGFSYQNAGFLALGRSVTEHFRDVWKYDVLTDDWTELSEYPGESSIYAGSVRTMYGVVVAGGQSENGTLIQETYYFDPSTEIWTELPRLDVPLRGVQLMSLGDTVFSFGGLTSNFARVAELRQFVLNESNSALMYGDLRIVPNPASDRILISNGLEDESAAELLLLDMHGRLIKRVDAPISSYAVHLDVSQQKAGVYILIWQNQSQRRSARLVIMK